MTTTVNTLIAKIETLGTALKGPNDTKMVQVKLKEANGKSYEWSSFHVDTFKEYQVGDVIEIEPKLVFKEGNKWPFRNIERVLGKRESSEINTLDVLAQQTGQPAQAQTAANGSDLAKAIERRSIERQTSVKLVVELLKGVCGIDDLPMVVDAVIKAAEPLEAHLARQGVLANIPAPTAPTKATGAVNGAAHDNGTANEGPIKMETIGDLFTGALKRFRKSKADVLDTLCYETQEKLLEAMTPQTAWDSLLSIWEGPPVNASGEPNN